MVPSAQLSASAQPIPRVWPRDRPEEHSISDAMQLSFGGLQSVRLLSFLYVFFIEAMMSAVALRYGPSCRVAMPRSSAPRTPSDACVVAAKGGAVVRYDFT